MNKVILSGRLVKDPEMRYAQGGGTAIVRYTLAVDRRFKREGGQSADFISCVAFGKSAEFVLNYLRKGVKIILTGRLQTGSYMKDDGTKVYTTDVVAEDHEFAESKAASERYGQESERHSESPSPGYGDASSDASEQFGNFEELDNEDGDLPF